MRRLPSLALVFLLGLAPAAAQQWPNTIPDQSVIGRIGAGGSSGPAQAIPFATLAGNLQQSGTACPSTIVPFQLFVNTSGDPTADVLSMWDGTQCVPIGTLNRSNHTFSQAVGSGGLDTAFGTTRGSILERGASAWVISPPGTSGLPWVSNGPGADPAYQALAANGGGTGLTNPTAHAVPIAEGSSNFALVGPGTSGLPLVGGGGSADPSFTALGNGGLATVNAATLKGNPTASNSQTVSDFTIGSLTQSTVPDTANDMLLIWDHTAGTFKKITPGTIASSATAGVASLNTLTGALSIAVGPGVNVTASGGNTLTITNGAIHPQGRLTLASHTPVMTAGVTSGGTLYYDCDAGGYTPYYNGTIDQADAITGCELSTAMASTGTGVLNANNNFDVFWVHSGASRICVVTDGSGNGWGGTGDTGGSLTARSPSAGYSTLDFTTRGYVTNKNALTHCYNGTTDYGSVAANQGTYLGTICTDAAAAGKVTFALNVAAGNPPAAGSRNCLWNQYNRREATAFVQDTGTCTYSSATIHEHCGNATDSIKLVLGNPTDAFTATSTDQVGTVAAGNAAGFFAPGLDSLTSFSNVRCYIQNATANQTFAEYACPASITPQVGLHEITMNEASDGTNNNSFGCGASGFCGLSAKWLY